MSELKDRFVTENDPKKIKDLVRVGAIERESEEAQIPLLEAVYWAEKGVLDIEKEDMLKSLKKGGVLVEEKCLIIKYLNDLGHVTRASGDGDYLRVHEKGIKRGEDRTRYVLKVVEQNWNPNFDEIDKMIEFAAKVRKELLIGKVEDGRIIFYKIDRKKF